MTEASDYIKRIVTPMRNDLKVRKLCEDAGFKVHREKPSVYRIHRKKIPNLCAARSVRVNILTKTIRDLQMQLEYPLKRMRDIEVVINYGTEPSACERILTEEHATHTT